MKQKNFLAKKKHRRTQRRVKARVKAFEAGELKFEQLPLLAQELVARKRRQAARRAAAAQ